MNPLNSTKGYTFIEISVVLFLIALTMGLIIPRIHYSILTDNLKSSSRKLTGLIKELREKAIEEQKPVILHFDLGLNKFWSDSPDMNEEELLFARENAISLPADVRVLDVWFRGKGKRMNGVAAILFNKKGYVQKSAIHLVCDDNREFTLLLSPFLLKVKIFDKYVDFDD